MTTPTYEDVLAAEEHANDTRQSYLRGAGWTPICDLPGAEWLWRKTVDETTLSVNQSVALTIQRELDPGPERDDGDHPDRP